MRRSILTAGAAMLLCSTAALAQSATSPAAPSAPPAANSVQGNTPATTEGSKSVGNNTAATDAGPLRERIRDMLQKAGFSDIRVMPSSFMIRAKDRGGNPVVMSVSPDSVTEVSQVGTDNNTNDAANGSGDMSNSNAANNAGSINNGSTDVGSTNNGSTSQFVTLAPNDKLSSNLVGLDVYNNANQNIGQIKDVAFGPHGRTQAYIVSVGGLLGVGQHYVALNPNDIKVSYNNSDQKWHATTNANAGELKAAPEFQYSGRFNASKS